MTFVPSLSKEFLSEMLRGTLPDFADGDWNLKVILESEPEFVGWNVANALYQETLATWVFPIEQPSRTPTGLQWELPEETSVNVTHDGILKIEVWFEDLKVATIFGNWLAKADNTLWISKTFGMELG